MIEEIEKEMLSGKKILYDQKSAKSICSSSEMGSFWFLGVSGILSNQQASNSFLKYGTHGAGTYLLYTISKSTPLNHLCYLMDNPFWIEIKITSFTPNLYFTSGLSSFRMRSLDLRLRKLGNYITPLRIFW